MGSEMCIRDSVTCGRCGWPHRLIVDNPVCELTLGDFMQLYHRSFVCDGWRGAHAHAPPWAAWDEEYDHPPVSFGNFIGGWLGFWQSQRLLHFARRWWEWKGGWMHRWGDQQYWMPALWMMGANDSSSVLDLHHLRYSLFRHSKGYYPCGGGYDAESNETSAVFRLWNEQANKQGGASAGGGGGE